jgi:hypothetical protein
MAHQEQLLTAMRTVRAELDTFVRAHQDQPDAALGGGWSLHDAIAHVALWDRMAARKLTGAPLPDGEELAAAEDWDLDTFNDALRARWHDRSMGDVLGEYVAAYLAVDSAVEDAEDEDCAPGSRLWRVIAEDSAGHYPAHFPVQNLFAE